MKLIPKIILIGVVVVVIAVVIDSVEADVGDEVDDV
jgi:hypothetical protein